MTRKIACEDDAGMESEDQMDSASIDKGSCGGFLGGVILKKGPWTAAEDAILVEHIKKFGEGNWNAVQKHSGLLRCGKSCRLRWTNHLRPNLKKGTFTAEEEHTIVDLHAKMGNKWARMAQHLPGRTDNEIKNYWNTRVKRRQRAGLPLYPPDICSQAWIDGKHNLSSKFDSGDVRHQEVLQEGNFDIPDVKFENYKADQGAFSYAPAFPDISMGGSFSLLSEVLQSPQSFSSMLPILPHRKQFRESVALSPALFGAGTCKFPQFDACENGSWEKVHQPAGFSLPYNPDPGIRNLAPSEGATSGSHALFNGNFSTSKPLPEAMKLELPSLQYPEASYDFWKPSPSLPRLIDNDDPSIQSSHATMQIQSDSLLPQSSGLLEEIIHESGALRNAKNKSSGKISNSSGSMVTDVVVSSLLNPCSTDWDGYVDPNSPLGQSTTSIFDESTPVSACSLDELIPAMAMPQTVQFVHTPEFSTADAVLDPDSFEQSSKCMDDILVSHFSDGIYGDYCNQIAAGSYYI